MRVRCVFIFLVMLGMAAAACEGSVSPAADGSEPGVDAYGDGDGTEAPADCEDGGDMPDEGGGDDAGTADGGDGLPSGEIQVRVENVTSSTIAIAWDPVAGAAGVGVHVAAEPSQAADGSLPDSLQVADLPGDASAFTIEDVSAASDLFIRVVAEVGGGDPPWGNAHARTPGGPRAVLDTPLREVHAYETNVLMLVIENRGTHYEGSALAGNLGAAWQGGSWSVERREGSPVGVSAVHRHTIPVAQPDYPVGFDRYGDDNYVDVDHRIFLVLDQPIGSRDVLTVTHTGDPGTGLTVRVPFSDRYTQTPLIQVNQVGYNPRATRRFAYVYGWMGDGGPVDLSGLPASAEVLVQPLDPLAPRRTALAGLPVTPRAESDPDAAGQVRQIDLAGLPPAEGARYRVRIPGVGVSWPTAVSEEAAFKAYYVAARGMFHNRWCGDLRPDVTEWSRPADHCQAFFVSGTSYQADKFPESTPQTDQRPLRGGHHDAGDFDIRPFHVMVAQYLLRAFEMDPGRFPDGQLTIPESGNGLPDLLDEALWSVAAWEQLQNADGSVRAGVESHRHPAGIYFADQDQLPYWTWDPEPWHTAYVSGLLAQAAHLVHPFDPDRAGALESAARAAYDRGAAMGAPEEYLLYGASELFRLTGESGYGADYQAYWASIDQWGGGAFDNIQVATKIYPGAFTGYTPAMADFVVAYASTGPADAVILATTLDRLRSRADSAAGAILDSPHAHRNGREPGSVPDWGAASSTGRHADMIYQCLQLCELPDDVARNYFDALSLSADYALGCNPAGTSYLTGLGSRSPRQPLHLDSLAFIQDRGMPPVPGIPVYGPVDAFPGSAWYAPIGAAFHPSFNQQPPGLRISDTRASVNMNEFSVWESQAPFTLLFATLVGEGMQPAESLKPGGSQHRSPLPGHTAE